MAGWNNSKNIEYVIEKHFVSEDELWSLFNYFFSPSCKKTSTYKFGFLKSILDSLFSGKFDERGYFLSYDVLYTHFAANYWNLVSKYHLKQLRYNGSDVSGLERAINSVIDKKNTIKKLEFDSLNSDDRVLIVNEVKKNCMRNVIGAIYEDFDRIFYGYNPQGIWINPVVYEFLLKYKLEIEKINYYEWAKKLENINKKSKPTSILDKLEKSTPHRKDLSFYRDILRKEFEENNCFYCGKKIELNATVDHVIPWRLVREDRIWNFVLSCKSCNSQKNARIPDKKRLERIIVRNDRMIHSGSTFILEECEGYSSEMLLRLWNYAKIGGYKEYSH